MKLSLKPISSINPIWLLRTSKICKICWILWNLDLHSEPMKTSKKLYDTLHYHHNAIEIAGRKSSRSYQESSKVWKNNPSYISDSNNKYTFKAILQALPGEYVKEQWYEAGNIFHLLFNGANKHTGYCTAGEALSTNSSYSYLLSSSGYDASYARSFKCDGSEGELAWDFGFYCFALRAIFE